MLLDPETDVVNECFAVVYSPRGQRGRFPETSVQVMSSEEQARAAADPDAKRYAARVIGPSRSSEGLRLYYLVEWLE